MKLRVEENPHRCDPAQTKEQSRIELKKTQKEEEKEGEEAKGEEEEEELSEEEDERKAQPWN